MAYAYELSDDASQGKNSDNTRKKPIEAEINLIGTQQGYTSEVIIINRNDYDWHDVKITINDHYSCWNYEKLPPGDSMRLAPAMCDSNFAISKPNINKVVIVTKEGIATYY